MTSVRERLVKEKDLLTNLTARSIQQRRAPTVARPMNAKRGLTMHVLLLIFFIILLIWYVPHIHTHTNFFHLCCLHMCDTYCVCGVVVVGLSSSCRTRVIEDSMHAEEDDLHALPVAGE